MAGDVTQLIECLPSIDKTPYKPHMAVHTCNPDIGRGIRSSRSNPMVLDEFGARLGYVRPCLKKKII